MDTVVSELARTNTAAPVARLAADLWSVWQTVSRPLSNENRALIQQASWVRRTLFPVQTAIFDTLARVGQESMQESHEPRPQSPRWDSGTHLYSFTPMNFDDIRQPVPAMTRVPNDAQEGTADSWRTQITIDDVSGVEGWLKEAKKEVLDKYGVASDTGMPDNVANLKESIRRARKACDEEEHRVSQLSGMALNAKKNIEKTNDVLLKNGKVVEDVDTPAKAVVAALTELAATADNKCAEAVSQLTKHKQALYVLQQAWIAMVGGVASVVPLCCICLTKGVDTVCTPCGHTFCQGCAKDRRSQGKCPNCRARIRFQHNLFFA